MIDPRLIVAYEKQTANLSTPAMMLKVPAAARIISFGVEAVPDLLTVLRMGRHSDVSIMALLGKITGKQPVPKEARGDIRKMAAAWLSAFTMHDAGFDPGQDRDEHGRWSSGGSADLPPKPGTAPIPEGHVRLYHQTSEQNLAKIAKEGIKFEHARGIEGPKAIYADPQGFYGKPDRTPTVEFHVAAARFQSPFVTGADVTPGEIVGIHYPWHQHAHYIEEHPDVLKAVLAGEHDDLLTYQQEGPAIRFIKEKYGAPNFAGVKDVRPPSEDVHEVVQASFTHGKVIGPEIAAMKDIHHVAVGSDYTARVAALAAKIAGPNGYISRPIVDDEGNVLEGQHRTGAMELLGATHIPITRVVDLARGQPIDAMEAAIKKAGPLHPDQRHQIMGQVLDMIHETGSAKQALDEFEFPAQFEPHFRAALQAASMTSSEAKTGGEVGRPEERTGPDRSGSGGGGTGGARSAAEAQASAATAASGHAALAGLPSKPIKIGDEWYVPGPLGRAREAAESYMKAAGLPYDPPKQYLKVDKERATRIAGAFDAMPHAPDDPQVKASYEALARETLAQWQAIKATGLKVEWIKDGQPDPYAVTPRLGAMDVVHNNHWWGFPTALGFGTGPDAEAALHNNPMLTPTSEVIDGHKCVVNDIFRIVHDYFGHFKEGVGFRADGEENAWRSHSAMYSELARGAMTSETRGQNSWVNFGPYGEFNRSASAGDTHYAPQKIGLMPEWTWNEGRKDKV